MDDIICAILGRVQTWRDLDDVSGISARDVQRFNAVSRPALRQSAGKPPKAAPT